MHPCWITCKRHVLPLIQSKKFLIHCSKLKYSFFFFNFFPCWWRSNLKGFKRKVRLKWPQVQGTTRWLHFHSGPCPITLFTLEHLLNFYSIYTPIWTYLLLYYPMIIGWVWLFSQFSYVAIFPVIFLGCSFFVCLFCFVLFCFWSNALITLYLCFWFLSHMKWPPHNILYKILHMTQNLHLPTLDLYLRIFSHIFIYLILNFFLH